MPPEFIMNHATFRGSWGFDAFVDACAAAGMTRVSIWGNEVDQVGLAGASKRMRDAGVRAFGYNRAGPFLASDPETRSALIDGAMAEIDKAAALGADHVLLFPGHLPGTKGLADARRQTADTVALLLEHARTLDVRLALEPLHPMLAGDRTALCTLRQANQLCDALGQGIGTVVDSYHVWWDPEIDAEIVQAGAAGQILAFHVNDWLVPTKHMLNDRGMMGDGVIDLAHLWSTLNAAGYDGPIEVEIFSDFWWAQEPNHVLSVALDRLTGIFGTGQNR